MSGDTIQVIREECKCGHDRATHFASRWETAYSYSTGYESKKIEEPGVCLAQCACERYVYEIPKR